jgi:AcrR family transcriptional regulator
MVYYYFPSKDDLFFAVVEELYSALLADLRQALEPDAPVRERVRRLYVRIGAVTDLELSMIQLIIREVLVSSSRFDRLIRRFQRGHIPLILSALADGIREGSIDPRFSPPLAFLCTLALGAFPQLVRRVAGERLGFSDLPAGQVLSDQLVEALFSGLGTPHPRKPRAHR